MFLYRILFFSYLIDRIIRLFPKLVLAGGYLFLIGIILVGFAEGDLSSANYALQNPGWTFTYLYHYVIWLFEHKSSIALKEFTKIFIAFITPYIIIRCAKRILLYIFYYVKAFFKLNRKIVYKKICNLYTTLKSKFGKKNKSSKIPEHIQQKQNKSEALSLYIRRKHYIEKPKSHGQNYK